MNKYRNKPCEVNGEKYRSQKEARRHQELLMLEKGGFVTDLKREVPYELASWVVIQGRKRPPLRYVADFVYRHRHMTGFAYGEETVEDCKGVRTEGYRIKRHLMATVHGIEIKET